MTVSPDADRRAEPDRYLVVTNSEEWNLGCAGTLRLPAGHSWESLKDQSLGAPLQAPGNHARIVNSYPLWNLPSIVDTGRIYIVKRLLLDFLEPCLGDALRDSAMLRCDLRLINPRSARR